MKIKSILKKLSWSLIGNVIYSLSQWGIVTIIARFGSPEDLGSYSIALALISPIVLFFNFQLRTLLATDEENKFSFNQYLNGRVSHLVISYIIVILVSFVYSDNYYIRILVMVLGMAKVIEALSDICLGYFQKIGKIDLIGKSQLFRGLLTVLIVGSLYIYTENIIISSVGLLSVMLFKLLFFDLYNIRKFVNITLKLDSSSLKLVKGAFPLGITSLIISFNTNLPKYLLDIFFGVEEVGIFSALYYILIASNLLITPIALLAGPKIARTFYTQNNKVFLTLITRLLMISTVLFSIIIIPIIFRGDFILKLLYGNEYVMYNNIFLLISLSLLFSFYNAFLSLTTIATRSIRIQPAVNSTVTVVTLFFGYFLISNYGLLGAAITLLISRGIQTILYSFLLYYILKKKRKSEVPNGFPP